MARIAVAATAPFGADVLERLAAQHEISALLTRPDAPQGRGRKVAPPPAKVVAERLGIPVLQPERPEPGLDLGAPDRRRLRLRAADPGAAARRSGCWLNVHPSLLPRWRGAAPVERAILAGDAETGVTIHETVKELDAGPIAAQERFPIGPEDDAGAVFERAAVVAARLLDSRARRAVAVVRRRRAPTASRTPTRSRRPTGCSTSSAPADELVRRVRALSPHIGARAELHGRPVTVWRARVGETGAFEPVEVQPDGGKRMDAAAWLRGLR